MTLELAAVTIDCDNAAHCGAVLVGCPGPTAGRKLIQ